MCSRCGIRPWIGAATHPLRVHRVDANPQPSTCGERLALLESRFAAERPRLDR